MLNAWLEVVVMVLIDAWARSQSILILIIDQRWKFTAGHEATIEAGIRPYTIVLSLIWRKP